MRRCWGRNIRDHLFRTSLVAIVFVAMAATCGSATDPLADLKAGAAALDAKKYPAAIAALEPTVARLPKIGDYVAFFLASARFESGDYAAVPKTLELVIKMTPVSPLAPRAVLLAARAYSQNGDTNAALEILRKNYATLPQPAGDQAMAQAFAAADDSISAVVYYQRVYYGYPVTPEAAQSDAELKKLRDALGEKYPPAMPNAMLSRAVKLMEAKQYAKARTELESLVPQLGGAEKDLARVRIPVADYYAKETARAHAALASLEVSTPEADAERLHFLLLCAQRLKNQDVPGTRPASSMPSITSPPTGAAGYPSAARTTVTAAPGVQVSLPAAARSPAAAAASKPASGVPSRSRTTCASGSPKRALNSTTLMPREVRHSPASERAGVGRAAACHLGQGRLHHGGESLLSKVPGCPVQRRIGAHAAGVGADVPVMCPLVILGRQQRERGLAVSEGEHRYLRAVEELLDHHGAAVRGMPGSLGSIAGHDHPCPRPGRLPFTT